MGRRGFNDWFRLAACAQYPATGHLPQRGRLGRQTTWPCLTRYLLMSLQRSSGVISISARSVSSGVLVSTSPIRLDILWTWVSTQTDGIPIAYERTQAAVFLPTIGSDTSSSVLSGTSPPYSSLRTLQHSTMAAAFCLGNPAGRISSATSSGSAEARSSTVSCTLNRLSDAFRVLSSRVRCDSIVETSTWKGSAGHSGFSPSELLPG